MTRKSEKKDDSDKGEGRDYKKLKSLLEEFVERGCHDYDEDLDDVLLDTAKTGVVRMPWKLFKPFLCYKLDKCLNESFDSSKSDKEMEKQLTELMEKFEGPPFTIQRLCELLLDPGKHYKRKDRYMRALERVRDLIKENLLVVTTQEPDLVWMRIPTLSQLLEVKPNTTEETASLSSPEAMLEKEPVMRESISRDTSAPISPIRKLTRSSSLSPRSLTPPPDMDIRNWEDFMEARLTRESFFPRKRSSSFRSNSREEEVELQEADSTVSDQPSVGEWSKKSYHDDSEETKLLSALLERCGDGETTPTKEPKKDDSKDIDSKSQNDHITVSIDTPSQHSSSDGSSHTTGEEMEVN